MEPQNVSKHFNCTSLELSASEGTKGKKHEKITINLKVNKLPFDPEIAQGCTSRNIPESAVPRLIHKQ